MTRPILSSRRDPRFKIVSGCGTVELGGTAGSTSGLLKSVSISGLRIAFVTEDPLLEQDAVLEDVTVRLGTRCLRGDFIVRNSRSDGREVSEYGGLFYPRSRRDERRWMECIDDLQRNVPQRAAVEAAQAPCPQDEAEARSLFARCGGCHRAHWLEDPAVGVDCACGETLAIAEACDEGERDRVASAAREIGRKHHIDLPAAHSIVFGLMTPEQALDLGHGSSPTCHLVSKDAAPGVSRATYDPAFKRAVVCGWLSPLQAFERGRREAFATRLAERHRISMRQAFAVADNRISLLRAVRVARAARDSARSHESAGPGWGRVLALPLLGIAAAMAWSHLPEEKGVELRVLPEVLVIGRPDTADARAAVLREATSVTRDRLGRPLLAVGPDPRSVLIAACESLAGPLNLEPIEVKPSVPPAADARLGVVRDLETGRILIVHIRKDRASRRWYFGDGVRPLKPSEPSLAVQQRLRHG